jgi:hypothetical protein
MIENEWRQANCPGYALVYCDCPYIDIECEGAWTCDEIALVDYDVFAYMNTNGDNVIN